MIYDLQTCEIPTRCRDYLVGLDGLEPTTSVLSGLRSNRLSYRPTWVFHYTVSPLRRNLRVRVMNTHFEDYPSKFTSTSIMGWIRLTMMDTQALWTMS